MKYEYMPFGKYKNMRIELVPDDYCAWYLATNGKVAFLQDPEIKQLFNKKALAYYKMRVQYFNDMLSDLPTKIADLKTKIENLEAET